MNELNRYQMTLSQDWRGDKAQAYCKADIRIHCFKPEWDSSKAQLRCRTLSRWPISDTFGIHMHTALSYTWGSPTPVKRIWLNDNEINIGQNLFDFLVAYLWQPWGRMSRDRTLWIDQISIDQTNVAERSAQVSIMNQVYKRARHVLVWLGREPHMIAAMRDLRDGKPDDGRALGTVLSHTYFSRLWVIQEVALTSSISIVCGEVDLDWSLLQEALEPSFNPSRWCVKESVLSLIRETPEKDIHATRTLQHCIMQYSAHKCQDPRDKVYGLLGLTPERWRIHIDYTKTVRQVYLEAVAALFEELFDILDPDCHYKGTDVLLAEPLRYRETALMLGKEMGIPQHHLSGLVPLLHHIQQAYLSAELRDIEYVCHFQPAMDSLTQCRASRERRRLNNERVTHSTSRDKSHRSIIASRRNPLLQDVVSAIGLQFADPDATWDLMPERMFDRWWFHMEGRTYFYNCPPNGPEH